jgi:hypothetical protein
VFSNAAYNCLVSNPCTTWILFSKVSTQQLTKASPNELLKTGSNYLIIRKGGIVNQSVFPFRPIISEKWATTQPKINWLRIESWRRWARSYLRLVECINSKDNPQEYREAVSILLTLLFLWVIINWTNLWKTRAGLSLRAKLSVPIPIKEQRLRDIKWIAQLPAVKWLWSATKIFAKIYLRSEVCLQSSRRSTSPNDTISTLFF